MENEVLSSFQAAELSNASDSTVKRWIKSGMLKAYKTIGGHYRIFKNDLYAFLKSNGIPVKEETHSTPKRILVVDDDFQVREGLMKYIRINCQDAEIASAENGFEAGVLMTQFKPDLVILDLFMPMLDGFTVCRQIKENAITSGIFIIVITGFKEQEIEQKAIDSGANLVMHKPIDKNELIMSINAFYDRNPTKI